MNTLAVIALSAALLILSAAFLFILARLQLLERKSSSGTHALAASQARRVENQPGQEADHATEDLLSVRLGNLLATCPKPVLILDSSRTIIYLSRRAETELDQPRRHRGLLESMGSHELDEAAARAMKTLEPEEIRVRIYAAGRRSYSASIFPYDNMGQRECVVYLEDISTLLEFGELRSQFAATVSHELRTPLTGIRALIESLQAPGIQPDDAARFLATVDRETRRLSQLIEEILFLAQLESGAVESIGGQTMLRPLVDRVLHEKEALAAGSEVSLENLVPGNVSFPLQERLAATVLTNLIDNAVKYSGRGSKVAIEFGQDEHRASIIVRDDGVGIDAEHLQHIFERFYRVDRSRSRRMGGTGLGLSIVKHIVESAGGEVAASSREGFGTSITVSLPPAP